MKKEKNILKPVEVSEIDPILNSRGIVTEWKVVVTFDKDVVPPHARGGYVNKQQVVGNVMPVEYRFRDSVMKRGMENVLMFQREMMSRLSERNRGK